jgi:hypothetical protein
VRLLCEHAVQRVASRRSAELCKCYGRIAQVNREVHLNIDARQSPNANGDELDEILIRDTGPGVANRERLQEMFGFGNFSNDNNEVTEGLLAHPTKEHRVRFSHTHTLVLPLQPTHRTPLRRYASLL